MKNLRSLFNSALLAALLISCSQPQSGLRVVSEATYKDSAQCWLTARRFRAFLVIARFGDQGVPYFVSARCITKGSYDSYGVATLAFLNVIKVSDGKALLRPALGYKSIGDNVRSDLPLPESKDRVYFVAGELSPTRVGELQSYAVVSVAELRDTGLNFEEFLSTGPVERGKLAELR